MVSHAPVVVEGADGLTRGPEEVLGAAVGGEVGEVTRILTYL